LTDLTHLSGLPNGENERNADGMIWRAKKFITVAYVYGNFF